MLTPRHGLLISMLSMLQRDAACFRRRHVTLRLFDCFRCCFRAIFAMICRRRYADDFYAMPMRALPPLMHDAFRHDAAADAAISPPPADRCRYATLFFLFASLITLDAIYYAATPRHCFFFAPARRCLHAATITMLRFAAVAA